MPEDRMPQAVARVSLKSIEGRIHLIRGRRVMFDFDLSDLYGVTTAALNQAVARNRDRFPEDFMFQLTPTELEHWKSQIVISNPAAKMGLRKPPYAFTEQGVAMLSGVLRSKRAVKVYRHLADARVPRTLAAPSTA